MLRTFSLTVGTSSSRTFSFAWRTWAGARPDAWSAWATLATLIRSSFSISVSVIDASWLTYSGLSEASPAAQDQDQDQLREFLYFEEAMTKPDPAKYTATWNNTPARGTRKASKSLWIFDKQIGAKRYSVTTSAGIKIQPYFDVPPPGDPNLLYFRVQSEPLDDDTVVLWVSAATAERLKELLGSTDRQVVSDAVSRASRSSVPDTQADTADASLAVPIQVSKEAFDILIEHWETVNDDRRIQQLIEVLSSDPVA